MLPPGSSGRYQKDIEVAVGAVLDPTDFLGSLA